MQGRKSMKLHGRALPTATVPAPAKGTVHRDVAVAGQFKHREAWRDHRNRLWAFGVNIARFTHKGMPRAEGYLDRIASDVDELRRLSDGAQTWSRAP